MLRRFIVPILLFFVALGIPMNVWAADRSTSILSVNHVTANSFSKDGDYYSPNGRILFAVSKSEYQTIDTLDELLVAPSNTTSKIIIALAGKDGVVAAKTYDVPAPYQYTHIVTSWNIYNKPSGLYMFVLLADKELVGSYALMIKD